MEQRPLRLGDIVDDYCPRERRITNHVIVALVEDHIRQTRCSTCDTEHVFKAGRLPRRRSKEDDALGDVPGQLVTRPPAEVTPVTAAPEPPRAASAPPGSPPAHTNGAVPAAEAAEEITERADDVWPAHRRLIRASLPRVEGEQKEPRPIPEFTMHQRQGRGGNPYRGDHFANGNGSGRGGGGGFRQGQPGQNRDHGHGGPGGPGGGQPGAGGGGKRWRHRRRGRGPGPGSGPKTG